MVKFGTLDYYKKLAETINNDPEIGKSNLSTTMLNVFTDQKKDYGLAKAILLKYDKGKIVEVRETQPDEKVEFKTATTYETHVAISKGTVDPIKAGMKCPMMKAKQNMGVLQRIGQITKEMKDVEF